MNYESREILSSENSSNSSFNILNEKNFKTNQLNENIASNNSFYKKGNSNQLIGLNIQYGIIQGYESKEVVHLSYFDQQPIEPRYYMFGR